MRRTAFSLALVVALLLSSAGGRAGPVQAGINIWTKTSQGMWGGSINLLAISPNYATDSTIFAGNRVGVFKSTNGGDSWTEVNTGLTNLRVEALAISPNYATDKTVFAGILVGLREYGHPVFKSIDGGDSWTEANTGLTGLSVKDLVISPNYATDKTVFAGTRAGVFKSTNGGDSWDNTGLDYISGLRALAISPNYAADNTIFAGTDPGVFKSTNGGDSWTKMLTNGSFEQGPRIPVPWKGKNLTAKDGRVCRIGYYGSCSFRMVGTRARKSLRQVVRGSGNAGDTFTLRAWTKAENPLRRGGSYCLVARVFHTDGTKKSYGRCFAKRTDFWRRRQRTFTTAKDYNKIVVSLRYNRQGGKAWFDGVCLFRSPVGSVGRVWALAISPNYATDSTIFAGTWHRGVFKSTNGGDSWDNTGLTDLRVRALAISPDYASDNTIFAGTWDDGVFKSTNGGSSWSAMNAGLGSLNILALALTPTAPQTIFAGTDGRSVWQYTMSENSAE